MRESIDDIVKANDAHANNSEASLDWNIDADVLSWVATCFVHDFEVWTGL
jgi:hypothetical protein